MQTTFTSAPAPGRPGMPADLGFKDDISTIVEESGGIAPGLGVVRGSSDAQVELPSAAFTDADFVGVAVFTHKGRVDGALEDAEVYENQSSMPVRRRGRIRAVIENAFTAGAPVYVRHTAGAGGTTIGAFRVTDTDTNTASLLDGVRLATSGGAGDLGILELNLP